MTAKWNPQRFVVETRMANGQLWARQLFDTERVAREMAMNIGTVRGQKAWANKVWVNGTHVATYVGGKLKWSKETP